MNAPERIPEEGARAFSVSGARRATLPAGHPPVLAVVVDTEEEFDWSRPFSRDNTATTAIPAQRIMHERVFDRLDIKPTYVVDWPVADSPAAIGALRDLLESGRCEIGTHLHPWVSPPHDEVVNTFNSYAGNLPPELEFAKLERLTEAIERNAGRRPQVFKAGRYGLGPETFASLARLGYRVDASIVPHTAFSRDGGPDFRAFDNTPFWFGPAGAPIMELPVTTGYCGWLSAFGRTLYPTLDTRTARSFRLGGIAARTRALERIRLSPEGASLAELERVTAALLSGGQRVFTLTYHSPSLVPGHTPYVRTAADLETFLRTVEGYCTHFRDVVGGVFLTATQIRDRLDA